MSYTQGLFKKKYNLEERTSESKRITDKYPERVPIIVEVSKRNIDDFKTLDKQKFLVPQDLTVGQFAYIIRKRVKLESKSAMYLIINGKMINTNANIGDIYETDKDHDNFLYVCICMESVFGN